MGRPPSPRAAKSLGAAWASAFPLGDSACPGHPGSMRNDEVWSLIQEELSFLPTGGVDWSQRSFSKRWSQRRLGWEGLSEVLQAAIPLRRRCFLVGAPGAPSLEDSSSPLEPQSLASALSELRRGDWDDHRWVIDAAGRWLFELAPSRILSLEFVQARDTRLIQRLREGTRSIRPRGVELEVAQELSFERSLPTEPRDLSQPFPCDPERGPSG